jgi:hypothetical protein
LHSQTIADYQSDGNLRLSILENKWETNNRRNPTEFETASASRRFLAIFIVKDGKKPPGLPTAAIRLI